MQPGLFRFGTDFGNGAADRQYFPNDVTQARYAAEKERILRAYPERSATDLRDTADEIALEAARRFIVDAWRVEGNGDLSTRSLSELSAELSEDCAVLTRADHTAFIHACFPSGWRPQQVVGKSFRQIHQHVPAFEGVATKAASLVSAMLARGPYVRFVWTISADDELDHHPEQGRRAAWLPSTPRGFLRVERQTTVPLANGAASLFLIRTFLYGFDELSGEQRAILAGALRLMPQEIVHYKGLTQAIPRALELLR